MRTSDCKSRLAGGINLALRQISRVDRALELRIALETLFLDSAQNELRFRLATTGARFLGVGLSERGEIAKVLRDFYDRASQAVHAGGIDFSRGADADLLRQASGLCRKGILKVLEGKVGRSGRSCCFP